MRNQPALDGVRACAVVAVLVAHSTPHGDGGALGVDVFFALSGFLITSLLYEEFRRNGRIAFGRFYMRRAWRLVPPLLFCLAMVAAMPNVYLVPAHDGASSPRWKTELLAGAYLSNFSRDFHVAMGYLAHTWSLAVEEQFYLLWPVAMLFLVRRGWAARAIIPAIALAIVARPAIDPAWLPARADGLLLGALLAILAADGRLPAFVRRPNVGAAAAVVLVLDAAMVTATHSDAPAIYVAITLAGLASALLIGSVTQSPGSPLARLLSTRLLVELGKVSYTVYLLHFPIFQWVAHQRVGLARTYLFDLVLLVPAVAACWFFVERPARRQKAKWSALPSGDAVTARAQVPAVESS